MEIKSKWNLYGNSQSDCMLAASVSAKYFNVQIEVCFPQNQNNPAIDKRRSTDFK